MPAPGLIGLATPGETTGSVCGACGGAARAVGEGAAPAADELTAGERRLVQGAAWTVASVTRARLIAAQGELPRPPRVDGAEFTVADLRNERDEVATLDYGAADGSVGWSLGRPVRLAELQMTGLRETSEKTLPGKGFACPSCGTGLQLTLATTQSIACHQCKAVVDVAEGIGADLAHYAQSNSGHDGAEPQIPLGRSGRLALIVGGEREWQVVGYQERCDIPDDGDEDEQTFWREYLLYHRSEGFVFLVDSEDGWSWVRPLAGAPQVRGDAATWQGRSYRKLYRYRAAGAAGRAAAPVERADGQRAHLVGGRHVGGQRGGPRLRPRRRGRRSAATSRLGLVRGHGRQRAGQGGIDHCGRGRRTRCRLLLEQ